jgi:hypothetical protein
VEGEAVSRNFGEDFPKTMDETDWTVVREGDRIGFFGDQGEEGTIQIVEATITRIRNNVKRPKDAPPTDRSNQ